jgi:hypothetical protein
VTFDADGSLLVAVRDSGDAPGYCAEIARFDPAGIELWRHPYDPSPPPAENYGPCPGWWKAITVAPNGAIVTIGDDVTGTPPGATDIILRKHGADGDATWTYYNQNEPDGLEGADVAAAVAVDPDGFIVAAGTVGSRPWVGRFAPNGSPDWIRSPAGERATDVVVAEDGTAFVGVVTGQDATPYRIARFDTDGTETTIQQLSEEVRLAIAPDGDLVFVAASELHKVDSSGAIVWERPLTVPAMDAFCRYVDVGHIAAAIASGLDGSIYLLMSGEIDTSIPDFPSFIDLTVLARFTSEGEHLSTHLHEYTERDALAVGPDGEIALIFGDRLLVAEALDGGGG